MATYYITKAGNDSNDGSSGSPWLTIAKAFSTCTTGDVAIINDSGVYYEGTLRRASGSPVVISNFTLMAGTGA